MTHDVIRPTAKKFVPSALSISQTSMPVKATADNLLLKFHYNKGAKDAKIPKLNAINDKDANKGLEDDDVRIFHFSSSISFKEIKHTIQESYNIPEIKETVCEVMSSGNKEEFFSIRNEYEWKTAVELYAGEKKLEIWWIK